MYEITKATLNMKNGDKLVIRERITTDSVDSVRKELHQQYECNTITFVYELITNPITPH